MSSLTRPPRSIIFLASMPRGVFWMTCSRSMSPVAKWQTQYFSLIRGACVPLPSGREWVSVLNSIQSNRWVWLWGDISICRAQNQKSTKFENKKNCELVMVNTLQVSNLPAPGGPTSIKRSCSLDFLGGGSLEAAFFSNSSIFVWRRAWSDLRYSSSSPVGAITNELHEFQVASSWRIRNNVNWSEIYGNWELTGEMSKRSAARGNSWFRRVISDPSSAVIFTR